MIKILTPKLQHTGGVAFFRQLQPMIALVENYPEHFDLAFYDSFADGSIGEAIEKYDPDILYIPSPGGIHLIETEFVKNTCPHIKIVFDYDDAPVELIPPTNPAYAVYGTKECSVEFAPGMVWDWVDKKTSRMVKGVEYVWNAEHCAKNVEWVKKLRTIPHYTIVTTEHLKQQYIEHGVTCPIEVINNAILPELYVGPKDLNRKDFRIGWVFGESHLEDVLDIEPTISKLLNINSEASLYIFGDNAGLFTNCSNKSQIKILPYKEITGGGYHKLFSHLDLDAGICHVTDTPFNRCKSVLKYMEYAAAGYPVVASEALYGTAITHNKTGLLYSSGDILYKELMRLKMSRKLRGALSMDAHDDVCTNHNINKTVIKYAELFSKILEA